MIERAPVQYTCELTSREITDHLKVCICTLIILHPLEICKIDLIY